MLILGLFALFLTVALVFWLIVKPWVLISASDKPFWWPWVVGLSPLIAKYITWNMQSSFEQLRNRSNLKIYWQAANWYAARIILSCLFGGLFSFFAFYLNLEFKFYLLLFVGGAVLGYIWPVKRLNDVIKKHKLLMQRELPFMLDLLTLCVEAGLSLSSALQQVARHAPVGPLRASLIAAQSLERTGVERSEWLKQWGQQTDLEAVNSLVIALIQAEKMGMNLAPLLRAQAQKQRSERFIRAETLALQAPVKMLFPMVICIFPCTFLIIAFPIVVKLLDSGF